MYSKKKIGVEGRLDFVLFISLVRSFVHPLFFGAKAGPREEAEEKRREDERKEEKGREQTRGEAKEREER